MRRMDMPKPSHPLVALVSYDVTKVSHEYAGQQFLIDFYKISFKTTFTGQVKYGQGYYDFEEGGLAFLAPNQLITMPGDERSHDGFTLYFHSDLISGYQLSKNIHQYGFFSYAVNEALFLSDKEKKVISNLFECIAAELENNTDAFSQDVLVSQIELLLNHSNRFYNRQFLTRKAVYNDLIGRMDTYLSSRFEDYLNGVPTVQQVAEVIGVSPRYLTDMLKSLTGQNTQQHIHAKLIKTAKTVLGNTRLSIAEVAYRMGFEHPQSFNKLFKRYTNLSPKEFRQSFTQ
jgi:AraC-like DNA-binding protein